MAATSVTMTSAAPAAAPCSVPARPPRQPLARRLAVGQDRLVGQPVLYFGCQSTHRRVAVGRRRRHRLQTDRLEGARILGLTVRGAESSRRRCLRRPSPVPGVSPRGCRGCPPRWMACPSVTRIEDRAEGIDVTGWAEHLELAGRLLRGHVTDRAVDRAAPGVPLGTGRRGPKRGLRRSIGV